MSKSDLSQSWEDQIAAYLQANIDGLRTCQRYAGEFDADSVKKVSFNAPAVFVACLGWVKADREHQPGDGRTAYEVRFAAFAVAQKPGKLQRTDIVALSLALTDAIDGKTLGVSGAQIAEFQKAENGVNAQLDSNGLALWAISWNQRIILGESLWQPGEPIPVEIVFSHAPDVGLGNEHHYQPADPAQPQPQEPEHV